MFGQFSTCDLVEFQRLLWSGGRRDLTAAGTPTQSNGVTVVAGGGNNSGQLVLGQQQQFIAQQQPTVISSIQQPVGVITSNTVQNMPVQRQHNFLNNQSAVSFTTQPTTRYIPNQPQARGMNQHNSMQHQQQPYFSQIVPLDLGKQAQEARAREMVPEFEEQYFMSSSPTKATTVRGQPNQPNLHRPHPHIPNPQAISDHLTRAYPHQQDMVQMHRQRLAQEQVTHHSRKKTRHDEVYESQIQEMEVDDHRNDTDYNVDEDGDDDEDEEYEPVQEEGPWKCGHCHKIYKRKQNFLQHQLTHKTAVQVQHQSQQQTLRCNVCQQFFQTDQSYKRHMKTHEKDDKRRKSQKQLQSAIASISGDGRNQQYQQPIVFQFKCEFCPEQFAVQQQLSAHEELHLAESTLRCVNCDKPFLREDEFNQHIKTHLTETVWQCGVCRSKFEEYKSYKDHLQTHLPVIYKDPPPKPPTPEKQPSKTDDDDIIEMDVSSQGDPDWSPSKSEPRPSTSRAASARPLPAQLARARYATGSNMKVTTKAGKEIIRSPATTMVRRIPNPQNPKEFILVRTQTPTTPKVKPQLIEKKIEEDNDEEILIVAETDTPHRPIPIRRVAVPQNPRKPPPVNAKKPPARHPPTPPVRKPRPVLSKKPLARIKEVPATPPTRKAPAVNEQYRYPCIICKTYLPNKLTQQDHILKKHCSQKSIEIILTRLEDDPELDLEIIDDEAN